MLASNSAYFPTLVNRDYFFNGIRHFFDFKKGDCVYLIDSSLNDVFMSIVFGSIELVQEYAKELVWQGRYEELKNQSIVTAGQIAKTTPWGCQTTINQQPIPIKLPNKKKYAKIRDIFVFLILLYLF